jgi:DNA damage-binding protein 1
MTDHPTPELIFLTYSRSSETGDMTFETIRNMSLHDRSARQAEYLNDLYVDDSGAFALVSCYAGKLKVIHMQDGDFDSDFDLP